MSAIYEILFRKWYYPKGKPHYLGAWAIGIVLIVTTWLFWGFGISSFWASTIAMVVTSIILYSLRKDLLINGIMSGLLMMLVSLFAYWAIIFSSPGWVAATYDFKHLSGILVTGIPIEELVFWFLAGLVFGPFYEYWRGERLQKLR